MTVERAAGRAEKGAGSRRIATLQALRALAAVMVVLGHLIGDARQHADLFGAMTAVHYAGGAGVDIFFVISGFIMVQSSGRLFGSLAGMREFLRRRLVRIIPLYWLATLAALVLLLKHGGSVGGLAVATSFAFVPFDTTSRGDGMAFPLLDLGWTLNYEMFFYVVFALSLPLRRGLSVAMVGAVLAGIVLAGVITTPNDIALHFWSRPIILEFVGGMFVALAVYSGRPIWPMAARFALVALAAGLYQFDPFALFGFTTTPNEVIRLMGWGVPALLMLLAAITGSETMDHGLVRAVVALGDASYALYLLHPFVLAALLKIAQHSALVADIGAWGFVALGLIAALTVAIVANRLIEVPLTRFLLANTRRPAINGSAIAT